MNIIGGKCDGRKEMEIKELETILEQVKVITDRIAIERDKLRTCETELGVLLESIDNGVEGLNEAHGLISGAIEEISQYA